MYFIADIPVVLFVCFRFRGWHKVKTTRGQHYVLTKASFGDNPNSKQLSKLYDHTCGQVCVLGVLYFNNDCLSASIPFNAYSGKSILVRAATDEGVL